MWSYKFYIFVAGLFYFGLDFTPIVNVSFSLIKKSCPRPSLKVFFSPVVIENRNIIVSSAIVQTHPWWCTDRAIFMFCQTFWCSWVLSWVQINCMGAQQCISLLEQSVFLHQCTVYFSTAKECCRNFTTANLVGIQKFDWSNQSWQRCNKLRQRAAPKSVSTKSHAFSFERRSWQWDYFVHFNRESPTLQVILQWSLPGHGHDPKTWLIF